jgi:endonuclease/exonuclease/phosphatase family metal-dependent hydrolase
LWILIRWKIAFLLLILLLLGYKNLTSTLAINAPTRFTYNKDTTALRVLSWNVRYFNDNSRAAADTLRRGIMNFIRYSNADVILLQDYTDYLRKEEYFSSVEEIRDSLGYKYAFISNDFIDSVSYGGAIKGSAIFSKIPFIDTGKIVFENMMEPESIIFADFLFASKRMRFYTTHLVSMNILPHTGLLEEQGKERYDSAYRYTKKIYHTIKYYDRIHANQADFVKTVISQSPHPAIITGDFNSVPSSYVYHTIKGNRQDAFIKKGWGLGHSYYALSKTLRIDYILADQSFKISQFTSPVLYYSDHFPLIADIKWAK